MRRPTLPATPRLLPLLLGGLLALLAAPPVPSQPAPGQGPQAVPEEGWVTLKSGLRYLDLELGEGTEARSGRRVTVHYDGWLADGTLFDSSKRTGNAFAFALGEGMVIKGWELGIAGMKPGGRRRLVIPPKLAYGRRGVPGRIPENAELTFEVVVLSVP